MEYRVGDYVEVMSPVYDRVIIRGYVLQILSNGKIDSISVEEGYINHQNYKNYKYHNLFNHDEVEFIRRPDDLEFLLFNEILQNLINALGDDGNKFKY